MAELLQIASHQSGPGRLGADELQEQVAALWRDMQEGREPAFRAAAAAALDVPEQALGTLATPPVEVKQGEAGTGGGEIAVIVGLFLANELLLKPLLSLTQDEIKKRMRAFWSNVVVPAIKRRTGNHDAVSDQSTT